MNLSVSFATLFLVAFLLPASLEAQTATPSRTPTNTDIATFVDDYFARAIAGKDIPGAAIVLLRDGQPFFSKAYGVADYDTRAPISVETSLLRQASTAKLLTWLLVMQLVREGLLDLDTDINRYLDFTIPEGFGAPITMRHLMTHSAGFADRMPMVSYETRDEPFAVRIRENVPVRVYPPGSTVAYSNYGAALAGYVVERLRGKPFERVVEERIFAPLGMQHSTAVQPLPAHLRPLLVSSYSASSRRPAHFDTVGLPPAGSASASAADMGRLVSALMNGAILDTDEIGRMMTVQKPLGPGLGSGLGLGFIVGEYRGVRYAGHGGSMPAGATDLQILPEQGLAWYIGFNGRGRDGSAIPLRQEFMRAMIDRFYVPVPASEATFGESTAGDVEGAYQPTRRLHSGAMQIFEALSPLAIEADGNVLVIEKEGAVTRWFPAGRDRFVESRTGIPLSIERDREGRVIRLGSAYLNPVSQYEPAAAAVRALPVFLICAGFLLLYGCALCIQKLRRKSGGSQAPRRSMLQRSAGLAVAMVVLTLCAWAGWLLVVVVNPGAAEGLRMVGMLLTLFALASGAAAAVIVADAVAAWRDRSRRGWPAVTRSVAGVSAAAVAWMFFAFDFVMS